MLEPVPDLDPTFGSTVDPSDESPGATSTPVVPPLVAVPATDRPPCGLHRRELDVLRLVANGLTNPEICAELDLSINSVKTYVRRAYRKIGATSRAQAVGWGARNGLLDG
ncbi:response regulator transcription factor [Nocardioides alkalitolerans]|uniref:response regulator transcription factor n=1 Tax=Nocardioides alkalitolerans TaxID=281714 RepID=UPI00040C3AE8|nr:helix-turn-helix transcriptional regulator [Nocardioides alkalitolerans]